MIKFSIITATFNSQETLLYTLNSTLTQTCKSIEHIFVDGGSTDKTVKILKDYPLKNKKIIIAKKTSIYEAINIGIKKSNGSIISILNSDDFYENEKILDQIYKKFSKSQKIDMLCGDVVYFKKKNFSQITRFYRSRDFKKKEINLGMMPPHTGSFIRKKVYNKYGLYDESFKIASDYDFFLRIFLKDIKYKNLNFISTRMRAGGVSSKSILSNIKSSIEIINSLKKNNINQNPIKITIRFFKKIHQLYQFKTEKINKNFRIKYHSLYKNSIVPDFQILRKSKDIFKNKNFIYSAMNLAFLGSYVRGHIQKHPNQINWPDGFFSKLFGLNLEKKPGRVILKDIIKIIKENNFNLIIFGNLEDKSKKYLEKKINKSVIHHTLPYGEINLIKKNIKYKFKENEICLITLPTPKQEMIAYHLAKNNKFYKIVCIGASVNMLTGVERPVPKIISNFEFLWRLRYETKRRLFRLLQTFYYFVYGYIFTDKIKRLDVQVK